MVVRSAFSLSDVGKRIRVMECHSQVWSEVDHDILMVIKAPRGQAVIFQPTGVGAFYYGLYESQGEAVRAFMEQHRDD